MIEEKETINHRGGFGFALILIIAGVILLLNNFGVLPWEIWVIIVRFWPILLIIIGIENLFSGTTSGNILVFIISIAVILFVFAYSISAVNRNFDRWITKRLPIWNRIQQNFPQYNQKMFYKCNPIFDDSCYRIYSQ